MSVATPHLWEREAECAVIDRAVQDAVTGRGGLLLVEGPAGVGKTRLLDEMRTRARGSGTRAVSARGTELEQDFAFGAVRQLFDPLIAHTTGLDQDALWAGPAQQARGVFAGTNTSTASGQLGDFAVLHGLFWLTENVCQQNPLVLLLDDLQWCDVPSLRFLTYLLPRLEELPLLVAAAIRTGEPASDARLLAQLTSDSGATGLRPAALSSAATTGLLTQILSEPVEAAFAAACHTASGGNPLLLCELARTLVAGGLAPTAQNAAGVSDLGPQAVAKLVALRMARLPGAAAALAQAVAVLGDPADLRIAAPLAATLSAAAAQAPEHDADTGEEATAALSRREILRAQGPATGGTQSLSFVHPLVRSAVLATLDHAERARAHRRAAQLLAESDAEPERTAAHLLYTMPAADHDVVSVLRTAATIAIGRGAPAGAYTYLRRALHEPPTRQYLAVLVEAGQAALQTDLPAAADHLQQAYAQTTDPVQRADLALLLGTAYVYLFDPDRGVTVLLDALEQLPAEEEDHKRMLEANLLAIAAWLVPGRQDLLGRLPDLRRLPHRDGVGSQLLACAVASREMLLADPEAPSWARRALADGTLVEKFNGDGALMCGWNTLLAADDDAVVMDSIQAAVEHAYRNGSVYALAQAYLHRGLGGLWRGQLAEAEHDFGESVHLAGLTGLDMARYFASPLLAQTLTERGMLAEAEHIMTTVGFTSEGHPPGPSFLALSALAQLLRLRGDHPAGLTAALHAHEACQVYDIHNPALVSWRTEAALALHAMDRTSEARDLAAEELALARQWGAPRALGRAMRVSGLLAGGDTGLKLLREAVATLEGSPARLEYAQALTAWGAAQRRAGRRQAARAPLRQALDLATACGAVPLADEARTELGIAGEAHRTVLTGPDALTASERRVAELAAGGAANREIAQALFITPKTVEVHLSSTYRKLGITSRAQLRTALTS